MRIGSVKVYNLNHQEPLMPTGNKSQTANFSTPFNKNYDCNIPFYPILAKPSTSFNVSFGINLPLKDYHTCPCCGIKMIDATKIKFPESIIPLKAKSVIMKIEKAVPKRNKEEEKVLNTIKELVEENPNETYKNILAKIDDPPPIFSEYKNSSIPVPTHIYTKELLGYLNKYESRMHNIEKSVFKKIKDLNATYPQKDLRELLIIMRPENMKILEKDEIKVLNDIESMAGELSGDSAQELRKMTRAEKEVITQKNESEDPFKRKKFLKILTELTSTFPLSEHSTVEKIIKAASNIPTSHDGESAFIVKYSGLAEKKNDPLKRKLPRSPSEIAQRLISSSFSTIEHIVPKHAIEGPNGKNVYTNIMNECADCNNRRGSTPFDIYIKKYHPDMPKNSQIAADEIINDINSGRAPGPEHEDYPLKYVPTLEQSSGGLIKIDLSALNKDLKPNNLNQTEPPSFLLDYPEFQDSFPKRA